MAEHSPGLRGRIGTAWSRRQLLQASALLGASWSTWGAVASTLNEKMTGDLFPVHDPCIIKSGATYHLFCTGQAADSTGLIPWRTSTDLIHWKLQGRVFESIPAWAQASVPGTVGLWAPDIAYFNEQYHLYYSCSTFGSNRSVIGLATNATLDPRSPDFKWQDRGLVVESQRSDDFNAIDPNHVQDTEGNHWLSFGSFWSGIKMLAIDSATGKPASQKKLYSLVSRPAPEKAPAAVEAPFIIERHGWYHLFASYDYCCRGASSSYYIVAGRSKHITGPYVGPDGRSMLDGYGALILQANRRYRGPGHCAVLRDGNADYLVYHAYDAEHEGRPVLRIAPLSWSATGWPSVAT